MLIAVGDISAHSCLMLLWNRLNRTDRVALNVICILKLNEYAGILDYPNGCTIRMMLMPTRSRREYFHAPVACILQARCTYEKQQQQYVLTVVVVKMVMTSTA